MIGYKKERRETYKSDRSKSFITKLRNLSGDNPAVAREIVEQANNYAGIFGLKKQTNGKLGKIAKQQLESNKSCNLPREVWLDKRPMK